MVDATPSVQEKLEIFREAVAAENDLLAKRTAWLMTLNGLIVTSIAILMRDSETLTGRPTEWLIVGIASIGAMSNGSILFSNYWSEVALQEANIALNAWLSPTERSQSEQRLRLHGRDPSDQGSSIVGVFTSSTPITTLLHPWFLIPILFLTAFLLAPLTTRITWYYAVAPGVLLIAGGILLILFEARRRLRRRERLVGEYFDR